MGVDPGTSTEGMRTTSRTSRLFSVYDRLRTRFGTAAIELAVF
jgi:hypothetical protein